MKPAPFLAALFALVAAALGQSPDLVSLKFQYDAAITAIHSARMEEQQSLATQYTNTLNALLVKAQDSGDLDKARLVRGELVRFQSGSAPPAAPPPAADLQNLAAALAKYGREIERKAAIELLRRAEAFDAELAALQRTLTKDGKLEEAVAVQEERKALPGSESIVQARAVLALPALAPAGAAASPAPAQPASIHATAPWIVPQAPPPNATGWITLFDGQRLYGCSLGTGVVASGQVKVEKGLLKIENTRVLFGVSARDVAVRVRAKKVSGQNMAVFLRHGPPNINYLGWFNGERSFGIGKNTAERFVDIRKGSSSESFSDFVEMELIAEGTRITLKAAGKTVATATDDDLRGAGNLGFSTHKGVSLVRSIEYKVLK